jgi:peptidoglycan hydrolase FlgJ
MAAIPTSFATPAQGALDSRGLDSLKLRAAQDPRAAVKEAAKQFETLFMQQLLKSMRDSVQSLDGETSGGMGGLGTEMLDQQYANKLSGLPGGLSEAIQKQLERQMGLMGMSPGPIPKVDSANRTLEQSLAGPQAAPVRVPQQGAAGFVQQHGEAARRAEAETGIPAAFMVAQAAHETGWGRKEIRNGDGSPSFNLFGIKAGPGWKGATTEITTTEYVNGQPRKMVQSFRAYGSYAESFADYARLMKNSPRYQNVVAAASTGAGAGDARAAQGFAQGLQRAGYATDPAYADKLGRVINTTLRLQRSLA